MQIHSNGLLLGLTSSAMHDAVQTPAVSHASDVAAHFSLGSTPQITPESITGIRDDHEEHQASNTEIGPVVVDRPTPATVLQHLPLQGAPEPHSLLLAVGDPAVQPGLAGPRRDVFTVLSGPMSDARPSPSRQVQNEIDSTLDRPAKLRVEGRPSSASLPNPARDPSVEPALTRSITDASGPTATGLSPSRANSNATVEKPDDLADPHAVPRGFRSSALETQAPAHDLLDARVAKEGHSTPRTEPSPPHIARRPVEGSEAAIIPAAPPEAAPRTPAINSGTVGGVRDIVVTVRAAGALTPVLPGAAKTNAVTGPENLAQPHDHDNGSTVEPAGVGTRAPSIQRIRADTLSSTPTRTGRTDFFSANVGLTQAHSANAEFVRSPSEVPYPDGLPEASSVAPPRDAASPVSTPRKANHAGEIAGTDRAREVKSPDRFDTVILAGTDTDNAHWAVRAPSETTDQTKAINSSTPAVAQFAGPVEASIILSEERASARAEQVDSTHMLTSGSSDMPRQTTEPELRVPLHVARSVSTQIADSITRPGDGSVEVRLSPEELGRVRVTMSPGEHGLVVHLVAERPETLDLLRRHVDLLQAELLDAGYSNLAFSFGEEGRQQPQAKDDTDRSAEVTTETPTQSRSVQNPARAPVGSGALDIRL